MSFQAKFRRLLDKAGANAELVVRKSVLELQTMMIERSPVDSGRFKSNWQAGLGTTNTETSAAAGSDAESRTLAVLEGWRPGQTIFLSNSMPYAKRLEEGWSKQAPAGMVRLSVQAYGQAIAEVLRGLK